MHPVAAEHRVQPTSEITPIEKPSV